MDKKGLKVVNIQLNSVFADPKATLVKVEALLQPFEGKPLDLIVLPETALTGYVYESQEQLFPVTELLNGWTFEQMKRLAIKFNAYIVYGYPERCPKEPSNASSNKLEDFNIYNSAMVIDRPGNLQMNYHKTYMYKADLHLFVRGTGWKATTIKNLQGQELTMSVGICQDILCDW